MAIYLLSSNYHDFATSTYAEIPVLYDETHRARWDAFKLDISSMANATSFFGGLEHHGPSTDGSFAICVASGRGTFVKQELYESIPEAHRPPLRTENAQEVWFSLLGGSQTTLGSIIMPVILKDEDTGKRFIMKLHAHVVPKLLMGMFISLSAPYVKGRVGSIYELEFDGNRVVHVGNHQLWAV